MTTRQAATPALAVSVIPVRKGQGPGLDVFVQHRAKTMDFAADAVVFPGGRVSAEDYSTPGGVDVADSTLQEHARAWAQTSIASTDRNQAREMSAVLLRCCCREVEEETGLELNPGRLTPWANWVTPPDLSKRFDTYFFIAHIAAEQTMTHRTTEADRSEWTPVQSLLDLYAAKRIRVMRPTLALLEDLADVDSPEFSAHPVDIAPQRPQRARAY